MTDHDLQSDLCVSLCASVRLHERPDGLIAIESPFTFPDGDSYSMFLERVPDGRLRVTDCGRTLMQLSYVVDPELVYEGTRFTMLRAALAATGVADDDGAFSIETNPAGLGDALLRLAQCITQIRDLAYLSRPRVESTFYEDLAAALHEVAPGVAFDRDYVVPTIQGGAHYKIDFRARGVGRDLFLFGVPNHGKAMDATITLGHLLRAGADFESIIVFADMTQIPGRDLARLSDVGGDMVSSLAARAELGRKVARRVPPPPPSA